MTPLSWPAARALRSVVTMGCAIALVLGLPSGASAESGGRTEIVDLPSARGFVRPGATTLNGVRSLQARILLPAGYDDAPDRRWPVVYLLHGVADNSSTWLDRRRGDAATRTAGLGAIVVMPEAGRSYYTDAWRGGSRSGANWGRYLLEEVLPEVERRYRVLPGAENHSIGGISMGGYGAVLLAAQLPTYFGSAFSLSGPLDLAEPAMQFVVPPVSGISFPRIWGPFGGAWQQAHNPRALLDNLGSTRLFVSAGNGVPDLDRVPTFEQVTGGIAIELASYWTAWQFAYAARRSGVPVTLALHGGVHDWPYFRRDLTRAITWGLFEPAVRDRTAFRYRTMSSNGNAFGIGFRFAAPPSRAMKLVRSGRLITGTGSGTVTLAPGAADADASGEGSLPACERTVELPFELELPEGC